MASYYVVAQYLPDPSIDERINFGVFVYEDGNPDVLSAFLHNWQRVQSFSQEDIGFLREFAQSCKKEVGSSTVVTPLDVAMLRYMADNWGNSIQITEPKGSLLPYRELFEWVAPRFLREHVAVPRVARTKATAARIAADEIEVVLKKGLGPKWPAFLQRDNWVKGFHEQHKFDITVGNGRPDWATQALSFEGKDSYDKRLAISALAWALEDVRQAQPKIPIGIMVLKPTEGAADNENYQRTRHLARSLNAQIVTEEYLPEWVEEQADKVLPHLKELAEAAAATKP